MLPTFAFAPLEDVITYDYRINPEKLTKVNELLQKFVGTNNFHNFTSGMCVGFRFLLNDVQYDLFQESLAGCLQTLHERSQS